MTIVNAIAKWHSLGERIRKREPRGRKLKGRGGASPLSPLGVSRDTDTKLITSYSEPEKLNFEVSSQSDRIAQTVFLIVNRFIDSLEPCIFFARLFVLSGTKK